MERYFDKAAIKEILDTKQLQRELISMAYSFKDGRTRSYKRASILRRRRYGDSRPYDWRGIAQALQSG